MTFTNKTIVNCNNLQKDNIDINKIVKIFVHMYILSQKQLHRHVTDLPNISTLSTFLHVVIIINKLRRCIFPNHRSFPIDHNLCYIVIGFLQRASIFIFVIIVSISERRQPFQECVYGIYECWRLSIDSLAGQRETSRLRGDLGKTKRSRSPRAKMELFEFMSRSEDG